MAKVIVLETSFIDNAIQVPGTVLENYEGEIGPNLQLAKGSDEQVLKAATQAAQLAADDGVAGALASQGK